MKLYPYNYGGYIFSHRVFHMSETHVLIQRKSGDNNIESCIIAIWYIKLKNDTNKTR